MRFINLKSGATTDFLRLSPLHSTSHLPKTKGYHMLWDLLNYNKGKCGLSLREEFCSQRLILNKQQWV